jgi:hypothetical protein
MPKTKQKDGVSLRLDKMTIADKILTMESLWDDLCRRADGIASPTWHHDVLNEREQGVLAGDASFCEWESAKTKIRESTS